MLVNQKSRESNSQSKTSGAALVSDQNKAKRGKMNILSIDPGITNAAVCNLIAVLIPASIIPTISVKIKDWRVIDCRDQEKVREFECAKKAKKAAAKECKSKPDRATGAPNVSDDVALVTVEERRRLPIRKVSSSSLSEGKLLKAQKLVNRLRKEMYNKPTAVSFFQRFISQMMPIPKPAYDCVIIERQGFCGSKISEISNLTFGYYSASQCHTTFSNQGSLFWLKFTTEEGETRVTTQAKTKACLYGIRKKRSVDAARQVCQPGGLVAIHKSSGKTINFKMSDSGETDSGSMMTLINSFQSVKKGDDLADSLLQGLAVAFDLCT